jgi:hypothetical protein
MRKSGGPVLPIDQVRIPARSVRKMKVLVLLLRLGDDELLEKMSQVA